MTNLLIDEHPMMVLPSLANRIGLDNAVVLQQINYWIRLHEQSDNERSFHEGRWWVFNTIEQWQAKQFTWWSVETVKRIIATLEKMGLVISDTFNNRAGDRTKWYTIDYDTVDSLKSMDLNCVGKSRTDLIEVINNHLVNLTQWASGQSDPMENVNLTCSNGSDRPNDLYKETKEETTSETTILFDSEKELNQVASPPEEKKKKGAASRGETGKTNNRKKPKYEVTEIDRKELQVFIDVYNQEKSDYWNQCHQFTHSRVTNLRHHIGMYGDRSLDVFRLGLIGAKRHFVGTKDWGIDEFINPEKGWIVKLSEKVPETSLTDPEPPIDINSLSKADKAAYERKLALMAFYTKHKNNGGTAA
jgi:hypothetical protein